jgi:predicted oxidoreductase
MIPRSKISPNGPEFSHLVYGTWRILDDASSSTTQEINRRLNVCVEQGMTTIDTAEIYGLYEVEESLGKALALSPGLRDKLEIVTKAGIYVPCSYHPDRHTAHYNATAARLVKSAEKSLRFLGTDHVELFLVHRPDWLTSADDTAAGLNQLVRDYLEQLAGESRRGQQWSQFEERCLNSTARLDGWQFNRDEANER